MGEKREPTKDLIRVNQILPTALDQKVQLTKCGLNIRGDLDFSEWELLVKGLEFMEGVSQWAIGDSLVFGDQKYGEKHAQVYDPMNRNKRTWDTFKWVASHVEMSIRIDNLSFSHHRLVASLEPDKQRHWLAKAEKNGWKVRELKEHLIQNGELPEKRNNADPDDFCLLEEARLDALRIKIEAVEDMKLMRAAKESALRDLGKIEWLIRDIDKRLEEMEAKALEKRP